MDEQINSSMNVSSIFMCSIRHVPCQLMIDRSLTVVHLQLEIGIYVSWASFDMSVSCLWRMWYGKLIQMRQKLLLLLTLHRVPRSCDHSFEDCFKPFIQRAFSYEGRQKWKIKVPNHGLATHWWLQWMSCLTLCANLVWPRIQVIGTKMVLNIWGNLFLI